MAEKKTLEVQVAETRVMVQQLHERLLGNGQKGVIQIHDESISRIVAWKNRFTGALGVVSSFVAILGFAKIAELLGWIK